ncbi:hypothetical protein Q5P01_002649 [Channa striata]|uniref:Rho guanine nucleotide exchange factor 15-like n=1 Tax=Channa striata TaxID=64152 RepID=A0AA88T3Y3_CHASR|nr:hypothetical protein Q5P01_002649 [Channa striata]
MSVPEASQLHTSTSPVKSETKPRPDIPPKPSSQAISCSLGDKVSSTNLPGGNVKRIVNKFTSKSDSVEEQPTNGTAEPAQTKQHKSPPAVKAKPRFKSQQDQTADDQVPPLPLKRSRVLKKQKERVGGDERDGVSVAGGRSAPDGKEVEVQLVGGGESEVEHAPDALLSSCSDQSCSCMCHLQRPGMKLIWVPVDVDDSEQVEGGGEKDGTEQEDQRKKDGQDSGESEQVEGGQGGDNKVGNAVDRTSVTGESVMAEQKKVKFHQSLNILISEGHRRLSDPGPHVNFPSLAVTRSQTPPVPSKLTQSPPVHHQPDGSEEDSIYECILPVIDPTPKKPTAVCKELDIPLIKVSKPARRPKIIYSTSEPLIESQTNKVPPSSLSDVPPPIPPRIPLTQESRGLNPAHRGAIALPQPTLEEWRTLLPSHNSSTGTSASVSSLLTKKPPPPPVKTDPKRLSSASAQSLTHIKGEDKGSDEEKEDTVEELASRRELSSNWESRLQDEPLYQTYRASVIHKEIKRQTVCRNISKTSVDYAMDLPGPRSGSGTGSALGNGLARASPVPIPCQNTLWQDLPAVRDSGELEKLTPEECKYQESMFEVLTSETSYLRSLRVLIEHFVDSRELEETLIIIDKKTLFSNILRIEEVSESFLKDLEERIFEKVVFSDICDIIYYHGQHKFHAYIDYVRNQIYQEQVFTKLMKNNVAFASVITRLQESPQCQRLPFMSFLLLPFQRITRLKMLIENILKRTKEGTKAEEMASKALTSVSKIIDECNTEVGKMRRMEELIQVSQTLEFDKLKAIPIISQSRYLEKKGELQEMSKGATIFNMRAKFNSVYLFLFNDLLIIATKKGAERFVVVDHAHRSLVQAQPLEESGGNSVPYEHCFCLVLLENNQGRTMERLLKAPTQSDMHRWMAVFPNPTKPDTEGDEVIYDDWDCPQVQCVEQYTAQQADELDLEPTEIVNVIRKTNEGWYEGSRLSDGQKGWFPVGNVIEITNEHVRRRNIRERYRVIQAANLVTNSKYVNAH